MQELIILLLGLPIRMTLEVIQWRRMINVVITHIE
jgi:hypothetical protein